MRTFQNLRFALRSLRRSPGLTFTILLTLALGIGADSAIFTVDYATLLAPLPYPDATRLVMLWSQDHGRRNVISAGDYLEWKRQGTSFTEMAAWTSGSFNIATKGRSENVEGRAVTPAYFRMLGLPFFLGRDFLPEEGEPGRTNEVILTHKLWMRLGADPRILGRTLRIDDTPRTVVGVLPPGLFDRGMGELTVPLAFTAAQKNHEFHWLTAMGRLKPGMTLEQAQGQMDAVAARLAAEYPKTNQGYGMRIEPLKNDFLPSERITELWLLMGAVGFVLLIACVNVANLLLARSATRQKELAVRSSLGASARAIFAQLLTESLLLALLGGALGTAAGYWMLKGLLAVTPPNTLPSEADMHLNLPVLLFTLLLTTLSGVLFGCAPAWYASRVDPAEALKQGGRAGTSAGHKRLRRILVMSEFALALTLLAGAGLALHSFLKLLQVDTGIQTDHVLSFVLPVPDSRPKEPVRIVSYYEAMLTRIRSVPGVISVSAQTGLPLEGTGFGMPFSIAGQPLPAGTTEQRNTGFGMATPEFFRTFGMRLIRGRTFNDQDTATSPRVAVVNEAFASQFLGGEDPLRQRINLRQLVPGETQIAEPADWQIIGVVHFPGVRSGGDRMPQPVVEVPFAQSPWPTASIAVRTAAEPGAMANAVTAAVHTVDPVIAPAEMRTMEQVRSDVMADERFTAILFASFAGMALLLAAVGICGVMAYAAEQRAHEIALRIALGATRQRVLRLMLREGATLAAGGMVFGLVGACLVGRGMQSLLFGVSAVDLPAFAAVGAVLLGTALLACYMPARRAASTDPMRVLRDE